VDRWIDLARRPRRFGAESPVRRPRAPFLTSCTTARERVVKHMQKTVYTTGEAAKICKVSQQTIIRCFDSGQLKGFRVPGSRFRRIPRDQLFLFMRDNGIPADALESGRRKILVVDDDQDLVELITDVLERDGRF